MDKTLTTERHKRLVGALIAARQAAGMTQSDLAARLHVYQSFVARMESGQRRVDFVELLEVIEVLGLDLIDLTEEVRGKPRAKPD